MFYNRHESTLDRYTIVLLNNTHVYYWVKRGWTKCNLRLKGTILEYVLNLGLLSSLKNSKRPVLMPLNIQGNLSTKSSEIVFSIFLKKHYRPGLGFFMRCALFPYFSTFLFSRPYSL